MKKPDIITIEGYDPSKPDKVPDGTTAAFMIAAEREGNRVRQFTTLMPPTGVSHNPSISQEG